jgi:hypothetical protein
MHIATPKKRDDIERKPFIPAGVTDNNNSALRTETTVTAKDLQEEMGGAGVF